MACAQWTGRGRGVKGKKGSEEMSRDAFVAIEKLSPGRRRATYIQTQYLCVINVRREPIA
jgi:hypothetical protein